MEFRIITFDEVTSTNDVAMGDAASYGEGAVLTALRQTAGRGQRGNHWSSEAGENLTFSLVLEPRHILVEQQFRISAMASLAACEAVRACTVGVVDCRIKWPNDLYVGDRKIGGILIEHTLQGEYLTRSVVGIGINVCQRLFDPSLPNPTSIANEIAVSDVDTVTPSPKDVLNAFCEIFSRWYRQLLSDEVLHDNYMAHLWRGDGAYYRYRDTATSMPFTAIIDGVNPNTGELTLLDNVGRGELRRYWFKEVEALH